MAGDPHREPELAASPQDWSRLISVWIKDLQSARRAEAIQGLTVFVRNRLAALAEYIDYTVADGKPLVAVLGEEMEVLERALFGPEPGIADEREFYERSAAVIRDCLVARLKNLPLKSEGPAARSYERARRAAGGKQKKDQLDLWCEFHCEAGKLPSPLLAVHDLMYYARLPLAEAAAVLGKPVEIVAMEKDEAVGRLRPLFDKARGKA